MTSASTFGAADEFIVDVPRRMHGLRRSSRGQWIGHPLAYTFGTIVASLLSIGTTLVAPSLLGPAAFGSFALLTSLFQYASRFDLGLSQLADRQLSAQPAAGREGDILWASWAAGAVVLLIIVPLSIVTASLTSDIRPLDAALAVGGGALAMIANAPVTIFRAGARIWEFTAVALTLQAGMTFPRLAGLLVAGVTGCFAVLFAWYAALVFIFALPTRFPVPGAKRILSLWRSATPLFVFNATWLVYLTANRWIAAFLAPPEELGFFAFGANLAFVGLGIVSTIAQVYYPKLLSRVVSSKPGDCSRTFELQALSITLALAAVAGLAILRGIDLIGVFFPRYQEAGASTVVLAISCLPLSLATWLIPICIATSVSPKRDATRLFVPAYAALVAAMMVGYVLGGTEGLAWGCVIAGLILLSCVLSHLRRNKVLKKNTATRIGVVQTAIVLGLSILALPILPPARGGLLAVAAQRNVSGPPAGWALAFNEEFDSLRLWDPVAKHSLWEPHYPWGGRNNPSNEELQYYVDPRSGKDPKSILQFHPFSNDHGTLHIRARRFSPELQKQTGFPFASGLLSTAPTFSFTYGYVEVRARVPRGRGLWSAVWLAPVDQSWPPEIDILEALGHDTRSYVMTAHRSFLGFHSQRQFRAQTPDLAESFHVYAVKWTEEEIVWYFDGTQVAAMQTPRDTHKPMYMILNLAVGGHFPGAPDAATAFPATFEVDYIRAYLPPGGRP